MKGGIKHIILSIIVVSLFLPLLQESFHLSKIRPLSGDYVPADNMPATWKTWFNGEFQVNKEKFLQDHFGYHNTYIRLHNQLYFYLFKKAKANGVIIGKHNYLYEQKYIDAYYGSDFIGVDSIRKKMWMTHLLADTLQKMNKTFLVIFAPAKGSYYPEYIPDHKKAMKGITNAEVYKRFAREMQVPHIDFHTWFMQQKERSAYPLMARYGIHWSQYGAMLAADSIIKTIEKARNIDIANLYWNKINIEKARDTDIDIEKGMNLLFTLEPEQMAYPEIFFEDTMGKAQPSVLVIGDSFYWQIFGVGISNIFKQSDFWYYFKSAHNPKFAKTKKMEEVDVVSEINQHEVIMILSTETHLPNFGWNFIETLFKHYYGNRTQQPADPHYLYEIEMMKKSIAADKEWMKLVIEKARQRSIPIDSMLYLDAKWSVDENRKK